MILLVRGGWGTAHSRAVLAATAGVGGTTGQVPDARGAPVTDELVLVGAGDPVWRGHRLVVRERLTALAARLGG